MREELQFIPKCSTLALNSHAHFVIVRLSNCGAVPSSVYAVAANSSITYSSANLCRSVASVMSEEDDVPVEEVEVWRSFPSFKRLELIQWALFKNSSKESAFQLNFCTCSSKSANINECF